jgi:hypothetical protein
MTERTYRQKRGRKEALRIFAEVIIPFGMHLCEMHFGLHDCRLDLCHSLIQFIIQTLVIEGFIIVLI